MLKRSIALCNDLRSGVDELQALADPTIGELRIGSTEPVMAGLLPAIIDRLSQQYPRLALHIIEGEPPELQDRHLRNHDIDLMIGRLPSPTPAADTDVREQLHESGVVVAGLNNPWVRRRKIPPRRAGQRALVPATARKFSGRLDCQTISRVRTRSAAG